MSTATAKSDQAEIQPPELPDVDIEEAPAIVLRPESEPAIDAGLVDRIRAGLLGLSAASWYLSLSLHILSFGSASIVFWLLGSQFVTDPYQRVPPLRATLSDREVDDESPFVEVATSLGLDDTDTESSAQQMASNLQQTDDGLLQFLNQAGVASLDSEESSLGGESESGFLFKIPDSGLAVTKGSFTAWTEPEIPEPGTRYLIIIEVRLPDDVERYRVSDLRGQVVGTDGFNQKIPYDSRYRRAASVTTETEQITLSGNDVVDVRNNKVQFAIKIPGAARLIKDTIKIRSRRLREEQELVLTFRSPATPE